MAKGMTKTEFIAAVADKTSLSKKDVGSVLDAIADVIVGQISGVNASTKQKEVTLPGLAKFRAVYKPAQDPKQVRNPSTGEMMMSKAKPASSAVKIRPLKGIKDAVK
jgi:nucleoid DNA-binding protein